MGEGEPVSKRSWFILGGILLSLWLAPIFISFGITSYKNHRQELYQERIEAWNERVTEALRPKYSEAERLRLRADFDQAMKEADDRWAEKEVRIILSSQKFVESARWNTFVPTESPSWDSFYRMFESSEPAFPFNKPNLSGTYISIPLTGPNVGDVQINAISGPK